MKRKISMGLLSLLLVLTMGLAACSGGDNVGSDAQDSSDAIETEADQEAGTDESADASADADGDAGAAMPAGDTENAMIGKWTQPDADDPSTVEIFGNNTATVTVSGTTYDVEWTVTGGKAYGEELSTIDLSFSQDGKDAFTGQFSVGDDGEGGKAKFLMLTIDDEDYEYEQE